MPEWKAEISAHLANLRLTPTREAAIVKELAQHLDESYADLLASDQRALTLSERDQAERIQGVLAARDTNNEPICSRKAG